MGEAGGESFCGVASSNEEGGGVTCGEWGSMGEISWQEGAAAWGGLIMLDGCSSQDGCRAEDAGSGKVAKRPRHDVG